MAAERQADDIRGLLEVPLTLLDGAYVVTAEVSQVCGLIEIGPQAAGYSSGVWTGPMIANLIEERFGVRYHNHHIPRLLGRLGFSVQRPRKRLARADAEAQAIWLRDKFPAIKKKRRPAAAS